MTTAELEQITLDFVEVDSREADNLMISLFFDKVEKKSYVEIFDGKTDYHKLIDVPNNQAYNAYHHPFPYLAFRGVDYPLPNRANVSTV